MNSSNYCYFNGDLVRYKDLQIHASDLQFQRGYGVFDFFRCRNGYVPWLEDYTDRLYNSIKLANIQVELDRDQFFTVINDLQEKNKLDNGAFKVIVTGGYSDNLEAVTGKSNIVIMHVPWKRPPKETFEKGVNLVSEYFVRPNPEIKTLYYFNSLKQQKKLRQFKAVDVLYHTNTITETSRASLFFIKNGQVSTPVNNILKGITRKRILSTFPNIREEDIEAGQLYDFDEIFMTSTSREITPVVSVEGEKVGKGKPGPITRELMDAFGTERP